MKKNYYLVPIIFANILVPFGETIIEYIQYLPEQNKSHRNRELEVQWK